MQALFNGDMAEKECDHLQDIRVYETDEDVCNQCLAQLDVWPALWMCLICGFVGCCDTSKNKHMSALCKDIATRTVKFRQVRDAKLR